MDRKAIAAVQNLRDKHITPKMLQNKGREILQFGIDLMGSVRQGDAAATATSRQLSSALFNAFLHADGDAYTSAIAALALFTTKQLTTTEIQNFQKQMDGLVASLSFKLEEFRKIIEAFCWDKVVLDRNLLAQKLEQKSVQENKKGASE
jgi:hypothetical protein